MRIRVKNLSCNLVSPITVVEHSEEGLLNLLTPDIRMIRADGSVYIR